MIYEGYIEIEFFYLLIFFKQTNKQTNKSKTNQKTIAYETNYSSVRAGNA